MGSLQAATSIWLIVYTWIWKIHSLKILCILKTAVKISNKVWENIVRSICVKNIDMPNCKILVRLIEQYVLNLQSLSKNM